MKIKHVYGNVLKVDIPLTIKIHTLTDGHDSEHEEDFYPDPDKSCIIELISGNGKYSFNASINGNIVHFEDDGKIRPGLYGVSVKCFDNEGKPYRYYEYNVIHIVCATIDAGIEAGIEFNAETYTLEGAVFVSYGGGTFEQVQSDWDESDTYSKAYIKNKPDLTIYQEKEVGKGLSTNDYTDDDKTKVASAITQEQDPTVPSWAKQQAKPSYTANEVGALPANTPLFDGDYNSLSNKPDLSGFITISVNNLVNYYLKAEVYTKAEVANLIAAIQQFHYEIYASTSDVTSPQGNVLYLIGPTGTGADKYEEYVYDATKQEPWVKIGDTSIDLSGYYTSQQTDSAITQALNTALADYTSTAALTLLLASKQDVINDLAAIRSGASAGATAYQKPQGGIPSTDMSQSVQESLSKADTALQQHQDISGKEDVTTIIAPVNATDATLPITSLPCEVGKYYRIDVAVETLTITLPAMNDLTTVRTVVIYLTAGTTPAVTIAAADSKDVYYQDGFDIEAGNTYEINALFNGAVWIVAGVKIVVPEEEEGGE